MDFGYDDCGEIKNVTLDEESNYEYTVSPCRVYDVKRINNVTVVFNIIYNFHKFVSSFIFRSI